jgi:hypothetical protein
MIETLHTADGGFRQANNTSERRWIEAKPLGGSHGCLRHHLHFGNDQTWSAPVHRPKSLSRKSDAPLTPWHTVTKAAIVSTIKSSRAP